MSNIICKACGSADLHNFYEARNLPVHSCLMVESREKALAFPTGDLQLGFCRDCGFIQNNLFSPDAQSYSPDYEETQSFSPRFMTFLKEVCEEQDARYHLAGKTALEIGCGKGEFLIELCKSTGCKGIGIDPGFRPERLPPELAGQIEFIEDFYGPKYSYLKADYVCCRHTLEHIAPVQDFMRLVRESIGDRLETPIFFELPATERILEDQAFWDIYYEHCTYFTLGSLARLFRRTGFDVERLYTVYDDQYLMLEGKPASGPTEARLAEEDDLARTAKLVSEFEYAVTKRQTELRNDVERWTADGKSVAIWGSGSKAVSYLSALGVSDKISAIVDINPHKFGKYLAGTGNEIVSPSALQEVKPDIVVAMNSIYLEEIGADLRNLNLKPELTGI